MRIRLIALAIATIDAWVMFFIRQTQTIDTSVWIALIAGVVGLLTLVIQTYSQVQLAKIKQMQEAQKAAGEDRSRKIEAQGVQLVEAATKLQEVHTVVNSGQSRLIDQVEKLTAKVGLLEGVAAERTRADTKEQSRQQGVAEERNRSTPPKE